MSSRTTTSLLAGALAIAAIGAARRQRGSRTMEDLPQHQGKPVLSHQILDLMEEDGEEPSDFLVDIGSESEFFYVPTQSEAAGIRFLATRYMTPSAIQKAAEYIPRPPDTDDAVEEDGEVLAYRLTPLALAWGMILDGSDRINAFDERSWLNRIAWLNAVHDDEEKDIHVADLLIHHAKQSEKAPAWLDSSALHEALVKMGRDKALDLWMESPTQTLDNLEAKMVKRIRGRSYILGEPIK